MNEQDLKRLEGSRFANIAILVKDAREKKRMSQEELSKALGLKNGQFTSNVERGLCSVPLKKLKLLAKVLEIPEREVREAVKLDFLNHLKTFFQPVYEWQYLERNNRSPRGFNVVLDGFGSSAREVLWRTDQEQAEIQRNNPDNEYIKIEESKRERKL